MKVSYAHAIWLLAALQLAFWTPTYADGDAFKNDLGLTPQQAADARKVIVAWLECTECSDGELQAVLQIGPLVVQTLAAVLKEGPSLAKREQFRQHLVDSYETTQTYLKTRPKPSWILINRDAYVAQYIENYVTLYKVRAATALGKIGGPIARSALQDALKSEKSETVREVEEEALANAS